MIMVNILLMDVTPPRLPNVYETLKITIHCVCSLRTGKTNPTYGKCLCPQWHPYQTVRTEDFLVVTGRGSPFLVTARGNTGSEGRKRKRRETRKGKELTLEWNGIACNAKHGRNLWKTKCNFRSGKAIPEEQTGTKITKIWFWLWLKVLVFCLLLWCWGTGSVCVCDMALIWLHGLAWSPPNGWPWSYSWGAERSSTGSRDGRNGGLLGLGGGNTMRCSTLLTIFTGVLLYLVLGGLVFRALEVPFEENVYLKLQKTREEYLNNYSCISPEVLQELIEVRRWGHPKA